MMYKSNNPVVQKAYETSENQRPQKRICAHEICAVWTNTQSPPAMSDQTIENSKPPSLGDKTYGARIDFLK